MIIKVILLLSWILIGLVEGKRDAHFFHYRTNSVKIDKHNMHWLFTMERGVVLSLICWIYALSNSVLNTEVFILSLVLMFSFTHNGQYYRVRNKLDKNVYPKGWWDTSSTSESFLEFNSVSRTFMAIVGFIGITSTFTFK